MSAAQREDQHQADKPAMSLPLFKPNQSLFYLQAKSSWHQRWQHVIEQCSACFIRY